MRNSTLLLLLVIVLGVAIVYSDSSQEDPQNDGIRPGGRRGNGNRGRQVGQNGARRRRPNSQGRGRGGRARGRGKGTRRGRPGRRRPNNRPRSSPRPPVSSTQSDQWTSTIGATELTQTPDKPKPDNAGTTTVEPLEIELPDGIASGLTDELPDNGDPTDEADNGEPINSDRTPDGERGTNGGIDQPHK